MHRYTKLLLASLTGTAILAMAISSANANRLRISNQNFRTTWTSLQITTNNVNVNTIGCPVTLEGSFHSTTIVKTIGALIGYVTRASVRGDIAAGECTGGSATIAQESLPWHIRYRGFSGTLPNITLLLLGLVGFRFTIRETDGLTCNATSTATNPAVGRIELRNGVAENLTLDPNARIPLEGGLCTLGAQGSFSGVSQTLTLLGATTRITVTLI